MNQWIIFAILAGLSSNLFNYINRDILRNDDPTIFAWFSELVRLVIFSCFIFIGFNIVISWKSLIALISLGFVEMISVYLLMKIHFYTHLSLSTIIIRLRLVWVPIIAFIFLHESLKISEYIGILTIFLALVLIAAPHKIIMDKGIKISYLFSFVSAINTIVFKEAAFYGSNSVVMIFMALPSVAIFPIITNNFVERLKKFVSRQIVYKSVSGLVSVLQLIFLLYAIRIGPVSKVTAIYQGMMIFSIIGGIFLLNEKKYATKKIIAGLVTIIGILLLV